VDAATIFYRNTSVEENVPQTPVSTFTLRYCAKNERKILKAFLLSYLYLLFCELFQDKMQRHQNNYSMEYYAMDSKIIQLLIQGIIETGEYTLEGIALYTHIPFDVIYDVACGFSNQFSITPWARVVDLYIKVRPDIAQVLIDKLLDIREKNRAAISLLLTEE
jgi:hypothetical protein